MLFTELGYVFFDTVVLFTMKPDYLLEEVILGELPVLTSDRQYCMSRRRSGLLQVVLEQFHALEPIYFLRIKLHPTPLLL